MFIKAWIIQQEYGSSHIHREHAYTPHTHTPTQDEPRLQYTMHTHLCTSRHMHSSPSQKSLLPAHPSIIMPEMRDWWTAVHSCPSMHRHTRGNITHTFINILTPLKHLTHSQRINQYTHYINLEYNGYWYLWYHSDVWLPVWILLFLLKQQNKGLI